MKAKVTIELVTDVPDDPGGIEDFKNSIMSHGIGMEEPGAITSVTIEEITPSDV